MEDQAQFLGAARLIIASPLLGQVGALLKSPLEAVASVLLEEEEGNNMLR